MIAKLDTHMNQLINYSEKKRHQKKTQSWNLKTVHKWTSISFGYNVN